MLDKTYKFYNTPNHGYIMVKHEDLAELSLIDKISGYSYMDRHYVFLEEHCDANVFVSALKKVGIEFKCKTVFDDKERIETNIRYIPATVRLELEKEAIRINTKAVN